MDSHKNKYLKYKNKYLNLKSQLGGECDNDKNKPELNDFEPITLDKYSTRVAAQRVTIDGQCYFIDTLYNHIITANGRVPHTNLPITPVSRQKLIDAYNLLHPNNQHPEQIQHREGILVKHKKNIIINENI